MRARYSPLLFSLFCLLLACNTGDWLIEQKFAEGTAWGLKETVDFRYDNQAAGEKTLVLDLAFSPEYPYQNIWFKLEMTDPQGQASEIIFGDTLMDVAGVWIDKQDIGSSVDWLIEPQPKLSLQAIGTYQFKLSQHMREEALKGIQSLSVGIE
ncbi:MAG: hypothetical protein AAFN10_07160 [Bacteroidota bacterium]